MRRSAWIRIRQPQVRGRIPRAQDNFDRDRLARVEDIRGPGSITAVDRRQTPGKVTFVRFLDNNVLGKAVLRRVNPWILSGQQGRKDAVGKIVERSWCGACRAEPPRIVE